MNGSELGCIVVAVTNLCTCTSSRYDKIGDLNFIRSYFIISLSIKQCYLN